MTQDMIKRVIETITPILEKHHVVLFDCRLDKEGNDTILRILIDNEQGSIDLDTCVAVSEDVSVRLDQVDPIPYEYLMEVASPGAERPLTQIEHYRSAIGKYVLLTVKEPVEGYDELVGTLKAVDEMGITLEIRIKTRRKNVMIAWNLIDSAMTTVQL